MELGERFHQFECRVDLDTEREPDVFQSANRLVFDALGVFGRIAKLKKFLDENSQPKTIFDFDLTQDERREENLLLACRSLAKNSLPEKLKPLLKHHADLLKSITKNPKNQQFLKDFLHSQTEILITNSFGIMPKTFRDNLELEMGSGVFAFASFFNHSCAPNVVRVAVDNKLVFVVIRPVDKDQQLYVAYKENFHNECRRERQEEMLKSYRFTCCCEACTKDYPNLDQLPSKNLQFVEPDDSVESIEEAKREFKNNCDYIQRNSRNYPSYEICVLIDRNRRLLNAIARLAPFFP